MSNKVDFINFVKSKNQKIMTTELKNLFDQFSNLIQRWNAEEIPNEQELLTETRNLTTKLREELRKAQNGQKTIDDSGKDQTTP